MLAMYNTELWMWWVYLVVCKEGMFGANLVILYSWIWVCLNSFMYLFLFCIPFFMLCYVLLLVYVNEFSLISVDNRSSLLTGLSYLVYSNIFCVAFLLLSDSVSLGFLWHLWDMCILCYVSYNKVVVLFLVLFSFVFFSVLWWICIIRELLEIYICFILCVQLICYMFIVTNNLILFYSTFELVTLPLLMLMGFYAKKARRLHAGFMLIMFTACLSIIGLVSIVWLVETYNCYYLDILSIYWEVNHFKNDFYLIWLFLGMFLVKVPTIPVYAWLPEAHVEAPTEASIILAGVLLKFSTYGLIRILYMGGLIDVLNHVNLLIISVFFSLSSLIGTFSALYQCDIKRIAAYSSIVHMNLSTLCLFISEYGISIQAALYATLSHGFIAALLFWVIGNILDLYMTRYVKYLYAVYSLFPLLGIMICIICLANSGYPFFSSFLGEIKLIYALREVSCILVALILLIVILCLYYMMLLLTKLGSGGMHRYSTH